MLQINRLDAGYSRRPILRQLSLPPIQRGSMVAVLGPNAVGKSTFLKALCGLAQGSGSVRLNDQDLLAMTPSQRARHVSYLPQSLPQAVRLLAYESVISALQAQSNPIPLHQQQHRVEQVFQQLGIHSLAMRPLEQLSGGQRQMVGLAQVLVRQPALILLDEPTSALDIRWQIRVLQAVQHQVQQHQAIALIAIHDINLALRYCDQLIVLSPQGLLAAGDARHTLTPTILQHAYGVTGRIEQCSQGYPIVVVDQAANAYDTQAIA